ncbi:MAG: ABC-F type ribosomal protection protein [Lachnospiraceae bacterium]|nr:ABC-F type ribosomal protection protein [Lachnospiraceae bacterium]
MLLSIQHINKSFGDKDILKDVSFHLEERDKCALVGPNGAGKSTLMKIIASELQADSGTVSLSGNAKMAYLSQLETVDGDRSIYEEVLSIRQDILDMEKELRDLENMMKGLSGEELMGAMKRYSALQQRYEDENGYAVESETRGVLKGLGFSEEDFNRAAGELSGGQKTRLAIARILIKKPELILLDEPTNHLDLDSISWLEGYLKNYPGAVLVVAHDRYFLDKVVNKVVSLSSGKSRMFSGNYTVYAEAAAELRKAEIKAWEKEQAEIKHQEAVIQKLKQFNREKSIKRAESREKLLSKMERMEKPENDLSGMGLSLKPNIMSGKDVLSVEGLSKAFPGLTLFKDLSFQLQRGEKVAIIGDNGTGKTTLLKIINNMEAADDGSYHLGVNVHIGYYDQEHQNLHPDKTLFDEISDAYPDLTETRIRNVLAAFLFMGDSVFKEVKDLSGGERGRLSLAKIMLSKANFLLLDEPTNHLDMDSREILEEAVAGYEGTCLYVSHDRYFINRTAGRILHLNKGTLTPYIGNYDDFLSHRDEREGEKGEGAGAEAADGTTETSKADWQRQKALLAKQRKKENDIKKLENKIEANEERLKEIEAELSMEEVAVDPVKCASLVDEQEKLNTENEALMEKWEELNS